MVDMPNKSLRARRYTGEDGFELSVPHDKALELTRELLKERRSAHVRPGRPRLSAPGGRALPLRCTHMGANVWHCMLHASSWCRG